VRPPRTEDARGVMRAHGGRQGGKLLIAAGVLTLVNDYLPGSGHLDLAVLNTLSVLAIALGVGCLFVPWERLHPRAPLAVLVVALAMLSVSGTYGEVSPYSYAVYYIVVFVWVGIAQPPRTSLWVAPVAAASYVLPFLLDDDPLPTAIASVTVAVPVCVLVGEVLARQVHGLQQSRAALRARVDLVERLAAAAGELGRDLDADSVARRLVAATRELFDAQAASLTDGEVVVASDGPSAPAVGTRQRTPDGGVGVPCDRGTLHLVPGPDRPVAPEDLDLLRLLAAQGGSALANARTHARAVDRAEHEQAVVDVLADGVLVLDPSGTVSSCNAAAAGLLGVDQAALVGRPPPVDVGVPGTVSNHVLGARWVEADVTVLDGSGERVVALRDVSRHRALDEAKDLFLATTGHELRTPLTAIKGYLHVLQRRWDVLDDARRLAALATVAERTDALVALTDHLLLGARAGAARHSAETRPFELSVALTAAVRSYEGVSGRHRLAVELPAAPLVALGDPTSIAHIVGQLVENAVKYSPRGGPVTVSARADGAFAVVEVADEGVGIPEDAGATLFAPFFQAGDTDTREYGGVGLGLYIVRQLVEAQGGTVAASNRPGGGTVVRFTLPLSAAARAEPVEREAG